MTNDEAIYVLKNTAWLGSAELVGDVTEAVKMAVEALKAQLTEKDTTSDCITEKDTTFNCISRQTAKPRYIDANEIPYCEVLDADTHKGTGRFMADKKDIDALPSAQPERTEYISDIKAVRSKRDCVDLAERVDATFYDQEHEEWTQKTVTIADVLDSVCDEYTILPSVQPYTDEEIQKMQDLEQAQLDKAYELGRQSAQPERLTDDDFETIRIHLNAYKEKLCNQQRWKEADEYQRIIDRFMAFASAQPDPNVLEQEYLKGWEDGRKNLLDAVSGTLEDFCEQCGEGKKYNGVMCGACNLDSWMSAIEEMKCTLEGKGEADEPDK